MKHNWEYKLIGDCFAYIKNGATIKQEKGAAGFPITRIETLSNSVFNRSKMGYANILELGKYAQNVLNNGDLLMSHINSKTYVGRTVLYEALPDEVIIHGMNLLRLIPNETTLSKFFYYITLSHYFKSKIVNIRKDAVNQSSFSISDLKKINIPVPPMEVQEQIVAELDKINEVIEDCRELLRNLNALAKSLFYDYFGDPVTNPKGWTLKTLGTISTVLGGSTPKTNIAEYWNGDLCWITPAELKGEKYIFNTERHISELGRASAGLLLFPKNTVLLTSRAPIGKVAIAKAPMYCNQGFKNLICDEKQVHFQYVFFFLSLITDVLNEKGSGATFKEISKRVTESISIPVPPLELQEKFAERVEQIDAQKKTVEETIANLQTLLDSRMDYWFN